MRSDSMRSEGMVDQTAVRAGEGASGDRSATRNGQSRNRDAALESLIELIEHELPAMRGSVLLLENEGTTLRHGAAPHLPDQYCRFIDGLSIGPAAGSCGTAAFRREQVIVRDIATDPLWREYRQFALPFGLRACWSTPILDGNGTVIGTFAMYYGEPRAPTAHELDLTQTATMLAANIIVRARAENALRENEARMRLARVRAEEADRAKTEFLTMMSHELRTPINSIAGYAMLMLDSIPDPVTSAQRNYLQRIMKAQRHVMGLIDTVLTHAKLEARGMTYRLERILIGELLDELESLARPQLAAKEISYDCSACEPGLVVRGDRQKMVQILLNIISNAVKFTPQGGQITVRSAVLDAGRVLIGVRDTGVGMTAEQAANVFEHYTQFKSRLTREGEGTGLGMAISRELARGMGGDLTVESELGAGTEFALTLAAELPDARGD